jgi:hypothetical protein
MERVRVLLHSSVRVDEVPHLAKEWRVTRLFINLKSTKTVSDMDSYFLGMGSDHFWNGDSTL